MSVEKSSINITMKKDDGRKGEYDNENKTYHHHRVVVKNIDGYHSVPNDNYKIDPSIRGPRLSTMQRISIAFFVATVFMTGCHFFSSQKEKIFWNKFLYNGDDNGQIVLITGATGRTGSRLYHQLKEDNKVREVRVFVRDVDKARDVLGCEKCDISEGIYIGDVTEPDDFSDEMMEGVSTVAIAVGAGGSTPKEMQRAVEFDSVITTVRKLAASSSDKNNLKVVFCSTSGTTMPPPKEAPSQFSDVFFWKLNAETFLASSGIANTIIVKPCGLSDGIGKNSTLTVGHHDLPKTHYHMMSRDDVASVMAEAIYMKSTPGTDLRFDLCSKPGPPNKCLHQLIESSKWEWEK